MAALSAARNVLLLDSRLRGNDEANGLFWFKNREFNPIRTVWRLILQHILPKDYRRARNFGFLHPNSKLIPLVQLRKRVMLPLPQPRLALRCKCCDGEMKIIRTRIKPFTHRLRTLASNREMAM
jgi:hypothetical protein